MVAAHDEAQLGGVGILQRDQLVLPVLGVLHRVPVNVQNKGQGGVLLQIPLDALHRPAVGSLV